MSADEGKYRDDFERFAEQLTFADPYVKCFEQYRGKVDIVSWLKITLPDDYLFSAFPWKDTEEGAQYWAGSNLVWLEWLTNKGYPVAADVLASTQRVAASKIALH